MLTSLWVPHFHLGDEFSERDPSALIQVYLLGVDWQLNDVVPLLKVFGVFLLFRHEVMLLDVVSVDLVLLGRGFLHAVKVPHLFN